MYRILLACTVPTQVSKKAADITEEFKHRPWYQNARCEWDGSRLILQADSGSDSNGLSLRDEFSDAISATIQGGFDGDIEIVSVTLIKT